MILKNAVEKARDDGYKRVWVCNDNYTILIAEYYLEKKDGWKNGGVYPFVIDEYKDEEVIGTLQHPYQKDTIMYLVKYKKELQERACARCLVEAKATRKKSS